MLGAVTMTHASSKRPMLRIPNAQIEPVAWSADRRLDRRRSRRGVRDLSQELQGDPARHQVDARGAPAVRRAVRRLPRGGRQQAEGCRARRALSSKQNFRRSGSRRSASRTASSPAITSRSSTARASRATSSPIRSTASRRTCCPAAACWRGAAVAGSSAKGKARSGGSPSIDWCRSTTAPRSTTACSPAAISKSAG